MLAGAALVSVVACRRSPAPDSASPQGSTSARAGAAAGSARAASEAPKPAAGDDSERPTAGRAVRFDPASGCARGFTASGDAEHDLSALRDFCSPGLTPLAGTFSKFEVPANGAREVQFDAPPGDDCVRVGAVVEGALRRDAGAADDNPMVRFELYREDEAVAFVRADRSVALLPTRGPICVRAPRGAQAAGARPHFRLRAVLPASNAKVSVAVNVWHTASEN